MSASEPTARNSHARSGYGAELRAEGMSTRAIGSALGIGKSTVDRDLGTVPSGTDEPERVTGLDGRERPATQPERPAARPSRPQCREVSRRARCAARPR